MRYPGDAANTLPGVVVTLVTQHHPALEYTCKCFHTVAESRVSCTITITGHPKEDCKLVPFCSQVKQHPTSNPPRDAEGHMTDIHAVLNLESCQ